MQRCHIPVRRELEERSQRSQPRVAAANGVVPLGLKMVEECQDERGRHVRQLHRRGRLVQSRLREAQERQERIPPC